MIRRILFMFALIGLGFCIGYVVHQPAPSVSAPLAVQPVNEVRTTELVGTPGDRLPAAIPSPAQAITVPQDDTQAKLTTAIVRGLSSTNDADRALVLTNLLPQLVALNATAAGKLAETLGPDADRDEVLSRVAQLWSGQDPNAAMTWAAQLSNTNEQWTTLADVVFQVSQGDTMKAINLVSRYPAAGGTDVLTMLAQHWADKDLPAALAWAENQPAGGQRDQMVARIALVESKTAPEAAGNLIVSQLPPGPVQNEAAISVLYQWTLQDFDAASAWVSQFPESPLKDRALAELQGYLSHRPAPTAVSDNP